MVLKILDKKKEAKDIYSLILEKPKGFKFYPAQFIDVGFKKDTRIMSLSSSPTEKALMFTYKLGTSKYKLRLQKLKPGDILESTYPAGTYTLDENSPAVMLAGGVGVAPHRSMIKWAIDNKCNIPLILIYSNSDPDFPFKKELNSWQKQYPKLTIHYIVTGKDGRLDIEKMKKLTMNYELRSMIYYLAGPPSMVDDFEKMLLDLGIDSTNIRTDRFDGY